MANRNPSPATRFQAGSSGNPGGKPVNARNRVTAKFLEALAEDFDEHGADAITACRKEDPAVYVRVVAGLLPKELVVDRAPLDDLTDDELSAAIAELRARLARVEQDGNRAGEAGQPEQAEDLSTVH